MTARLLGAHPACHLIPIEVRFICAAGGLRGLAAGRTTFDRFRRKMRRRWFRRVLDDGGVRGVYEILEQSAIEEALRELRDQLPADPWAAAGAFAHRLLDPLAVAGGAERWIEMTPPNAAAAPALLRLFPDMRLIHCVRDGRDVACSIAPLHWGPSTPDEALDWWAASLGKAFAACDELPPERVLTVRLEDLVGPAREAELARICDFVGLEIDPAMRAFFDSQVTAERAHIGRWRDEIPAQHVAAFEAHHQALVERLRRQGWPV